MAATRGEYKGTGKTDREKKDDNTGGWIFWVIVIIFIIIFVINLGTCSRFLRLSFGLFIVRGFSIVSLILLSPFL